MVQIITTVAQCITALATIFGILFALFRWLQKQKQLEQDIKEVKKEQCLITYGLLACLKGLREQGCNGPVTEATAKLEKHINLMAHDQE